MSTVSLQIVAQCASNSHYTVRATKGARSTELHNLIRDDFTEEISDQDLLAWIRVTLKIGAEGRTPAQIRNALLAGVNVTVTF